jgi:hypothetical protein
VRRLLLRNLLGADSVFLFLVCRVRLRLFLRRLLARGFRRFVAHKHNAKVRGNRRQLSGRRCTRHARNLKNSLMHRLRLDNVTTIQISLIFRKVNCTIVTQ